MAKSLNFHERDLSETTRSLEKSRKPQLRPDDYDAEIKAEFLSETDDPTDSEDYNLDGEAWNELPEEVQDY